MPAAKQLHEPLSEADLTSILEFIVKPAAARILCPTLLTPPPSSAAAGPSTSSSTAATHGPTLLCAVVSLQLAVVELLAWAHRCTDTGANPRHAPLLSTMRRVVVLQREYPFWYAYGDEKVVAKAVSRHLEEGSPPTLAELAPSLAKLLGKRAGGDPLERLKSSRRVSPDTPLLPHLVRLLDPPSLIAALQAQAAAPSTIAAKAASAASAAFSVQSQEAVSWLLTNLLDMAAPGTPVAPDAKLTAAILVGLPAVDWQPVWRLWLDPRVIVGFRGLPPSAAASSALLTREYTHAVRPKGPLGLMRKQDKGNAGAACWSDGLESKVPSSGGRLSRGDDVWPVLRAALRACLPVAASAPADPDSASATTQPARTAHSAPQSLSTLERVLVGPLADALQQQENQSPGVSAVRQEQQEEEQEDGYSLGARLHAARSTHVADCFLAQLLPLLPEMSPQSVEATSSPLEEVLSQVLCDRPSPPHLIMAVAGSLGNAVLAALSRQSSAPHPSPIPPPRTLCLLWLAAGRAGSASEEGRDDSTLFHQQWAQRLLETLLNLGPHAVMTPPAGGGGDVVATALAVLLCSLWCCPESVPQLLSPSVWGTLAALCEGVAQAGTWPILHYPHAPDSAAAVPPHVTDPAEHQPTFSLSASPTCVLLCCVLRSADAHMQGNRTGVPLPYDPQKDHRHAQLITLLLNAFSTACTSAAAQPLAGEAAPAGSRQAYEDVAEAVVQLAEALGVVVCGDDRGPRDAWQPAAISSHQLADLNGRDSRSSIASPTMTGFAGYDAAASWLCAALHGVVSVGSTVLGEAAADALSTLAALTSGPTATLRRAVLRVGGASTIESLLTLATDVCWPPACVAPAVCLLMQLCAAAPPAAAPQPPPRDTDGLATASTAALADGSSDGGLAAAVQAAVERLLDCSSRGDSDTQGRSHARMLLPAVIDAASVLGARELEAWVAVVARTSAVSDRQRQEQQPAEVQPAIAAAAAAARSSLAARYLEAAVQSCASLSRGAPWAAMCPSSSNNSGGASPGVAYWPGFKHLATLARHISAAQDRPQYAPCLPALVDLLGCTPHKDVRALCSDLCGLLLGLGAEDQRKLQLGFGSWLKTPGASYALAGPVGAAEAGAAVAAGSAPPGQSFILADVARRRETHMASIRSEDFDEAHAWLQRQVERRSADGGGGTAAGSSAAGAVGASGAQRGNGGLVLTRTTVQNLQHIEAAVEAELPLLLSGDTGVGKSASVAHVAASQGKQLIRFNMSAQVRAVALAAHLQQHNHILFIKLVVQLHRRTDVRRDLGASWSSAQR